jgi:hypothetical protein
VSTLCIVTGIWVCRKYFTLSNCSFYKYVGISRRVHQPVSCQMLRSSTSRDFLLPLYSATNVLKCSSPTRYCSSVQYIYSAFIIMIIHRELRLRRPVSAYCTFTARQNVLLYLLGLLQFLGELEKLRKATINFVMSVRPNGTTRLPLDRV